MTIISTLKQDQQAQRAFGAREILLRLLQSEQYIGDVFSINYDTAKILVHDHYKMKVGGIPSLCFLVASRIPPNVAQLDFQAEDSSVILLRVLDTAALPNDFETERLRVEVAQKVSGEIGVNWDDSANLDPATANLLSFGGIQCRVVGTFFVDITKKRKELALRFGSDLPNFYPNRGLKVYKPNGAALKAIVNYVDVDLEGGSELHKRVNLGVVRYSSTHRAHQGVSDVEFRISPTDLISQKTALFGMTRTGKSNTTKIILQSVFELRFSDEKRRVGQLVFDLDGEYANENAQDIDKNKNPSAIRNVWQVNPEGKKADVVIYSSLSRKDDPDRKLMLLNFLHDDNIQNGKDIIDRHLTMLNTTGTRYVESFQSVNLEPPANIKSPSDPEDYSARSRYNRQALVYRALLVKAGFAPGKFRAFTNDLFNKELLETMRTGNFKTKKSTNAAANDADSEDEIEKEMDSGANSEVKEVKGEPDSDIKRAKYIAAADTLSKPSPEWEELYTALTSLHEFIHDKKSGYARFENWYIKDRPKASGNKWADEDFTKLLGMLAAKNGASLISGASEHHAPQTESDYVQDIYNLLIKGHLVIVDQSGSEESINKATAQRLMKKIFSAQQAMFVKGSRNLPPIMIYVEEAHNLLPKGSETDLTNIWAITAKEGGKYNIGLVYATQEVSSIQHNILTNTANWFIGHLNNADETRELCKFYDYEDFEMSIRRAQDRGFVRVKTLSNPYTVPVQVRLFQV